MTRVAAQNLKNAVGESARADSLLESISALSPGSRDDVVFYSEALRDGSDGNLARVQSGFADLGYSVTPVPYNDVDDRRDRWTGLLVAKKELLRGDPELIRLGGRTAVQVCIENPNTGHAFDFFGAHFDDRSGGNRRAMKSALQLRLLLDAQRLTGHTVLAGVLNSTAYDDPHAATLRRLRLLRPLAALFAATPGQEPVKGLRRKASLAIRAFEMVSDGVVDEFEAAGLFSVDPMRAPTVSALGQRLRLDDLLTMDMFVHGHGVAAAEPGVRSTEDNYVSLGAGRKVWADVSPAVGALY